MRQRRNAVGGAAIFVLALLFTGCGTEATPATSTTTTTTPPVTTSEPSDTTTTATEAEVGPQPLPSSGFLEPGVEYVTTIFEPVVGYRVDEEILLRPFQTDSITGLENNRSGSEGVPGVAPYEGVAIHNIWLGLTPDEVIARIEQIDAVEIGASSQLEIGGFSGTQIDVVVARRGLLYEPDRTSNCNLRGGRCPWLEAGPMRIVVLDTPAGTLLVTVDPPGEDFEEFLPVAEEILAGISFPDLD
jgi:hypothetical protein